MLRRRNPSQPETTQKLDIDRLPVPQQFLRSQDESQHQNNSSIHLRPTSPVIGEVGTVAASHHLASDEIAQSLQAIEDEENLPKKRRKRVSKKAVKRSLIIVALVMLGVGGFLGYKVIFASNSVFQGNIFDVFSGRALKTDSLGRSNILLFGTSEDDPGHADSGSELTDSMMVISVDQTKKNAVMFSIPRDLWVDYGQSCLAGYQGKD